MTTLLLLLILFVVFTSIVILVRIIWWLLWPFLKLANSAMPLFGDTPLIRLMSLGLVAFLFPDSVTRLISEAIDVVLDITSAMAYSIGRIFDVLDRNRFDLTAAQFVEVARGDAQESLIRFSRALEQLGNVPIDRVVIGIAVWAAIGTAMSLIASGRAGSLQNLHARVQTIPEVYRHNLLLFIVFSIGCYMSIAAMVATPWLKQFSIPDSAIGTELRNSLDELVPSDDKFDRLYPQTLMDPRIASDVETAMIANLTNADPSIIAKRTRYLEIIKEQLNQAKDEWAHQRDDVKSDIKKARNRCEDVYSRYAHADLTPRERGGYANTLSKWLHDYAEVSEERLQSYKEHIYRYQREVEEWLVDANDIGEARSLARPPHFARGDFAWSIARLKVADEGIPLPGEDIALGPFGFFAAWLIRTRSLGLTLITGMIGFGIIGSATSTFIKESGSRRPGQPLVSNLPDVVVRGMSAAVIVFLGVEGGLAVFAAGELEPNAYVLFFTCLVGAVFSENVWTWARDRLNSVFATPSQRETANVRQEHVPQEHVAEQDNP